MGLFDDVSRFLENRLEEFLKNNPHLELQSIEEELKEQSTVLQTLIVELQQKKATLEKKILTLAEEVKTWHFRVEKARSAGREDLARSAEEREGQLLREGNEVWGQMTATKKRLIQAQDLLPQIEKKRQEVKQKLLDLKQQEKKSTNTSNTSYDQGWSHSQTLNFRADYDPLEQQFQQLELEAELDRMKRKS